MPKKKKNLWRCLKKVISSNDSSVELKSESLSHHSIYWMEKEMFSFSKKI